MSEAVITRRFLLASGVSCLAAGPILAEAPSRSLRPVARPAAALRLIAAKDLIADAGLSGEVGFAVADLSTGQLLDQGGAQSKLPPASVTKVLTALYALSSLGAGHRFETRLIGTGPVRDGILKGDLILLGGGDPTLDTDALAVMAASLKSKGLRSITGRFLVNDSALPRQSRIDPGQPEHVGYNPAISGLSLNFNRVHFEWRRAGENYRISMDARSRNFAPAVEVARMIVAERKMPVYSYRDGVTYDGWSVARGALGKGGARWLPVRKPALYAGDVFRTLSGSQGIELPRPVVSRGEARGQVLARMASPPLSEIVAGMLKHSTNLTAEVIGMAATRARKGAVGSLRASAAEMSRWAKGALGIPGAKFVDHSGLGDRSRASPADILMALVRAEEEGDFSRLLKPTKMLDARGRPIRDHPISVRAKTGTLNFVANLAGYVTTPNGRQLAFVIFCADTAARSRIAPEDRERPKGARQWNRKARRLHQSMIEIWGDVYAT